MKDFLFSSENKAPQYEICRPDLTRVSGNHLAFLHHRGKCHQSCRSKQSMTKSRIAQISLKPNKYLCCGSILKIFFTGVKISFAMKQIIMYE